MRWRPLALETAPAGNLHGTSDALYHNRHTQRSLRRSVALGRCIPSGASVLDVGCNRGITSQYLLDSGVAKSVTGVELYRDTVAPTLLEHPDFTLIESDVVKLSLLETYDHVVYGAVHHHVLHLHGLSAAVNCLQNLADHCGDTLYFETGHVTEGSRWPWQSSIRRYFSTDEEHIHYMVSCIEHRVLDISMVGRFWIHGVRRAYLAIKLKPLTSRAQVSCNDSLDDLDTTNMVWQGRTFGSEKQRVGPEYGSDSDSPTRFAVAQSKGQGKVFLKEHIHRPIAAIRETALAVQIPFDWAIRPSGWHKNSSTLVFPNVDSCVRFSDLHDLDLDTRHQLAMKIETIFKEAEQHQVVVDSGPLLPSHGKHSVLELCDFNPNNILIRTTSAAIDVFVVDFEHFSSNNRARNRLHLSRMLRSLGIHRTKALWLGVVGYAGQISDVVLSQTGSFKWRVIHRRPALLALLVTVGRTRTGHLEQWLVNTIRRR